MLLSGCGHTTETSSGVTVTMPKDDTVNGYRTGSATYEKVPADTISKIPHNGLYYANMDSKVFHLSGCSYAQKILDENLYISEFKDELLENGYSPCSKCLEKN